MMYSVCSTVAPVPRSKNSKWCDFEVTVGELQRFFSEEPV